MDNNVEQLREHFSQPTRKPLTPEQVQEGKKMVKETQRNQACPCGCGKKAKQCPNGRRVLEFKRYL